jgi:hypothetical protein
LFLSGATCSGETPRLAALPSGRQAFLESPYHLFDWDFFCFTLPDNDLVVVLFDLF